VNYSVVTDLIAFIIISIVIIVIIIIILEYFTFNAAIVSLLFHADDVNTTVALFWAHSNIVSCRSDTHIHIISYDSQCEICDQSNISLYNSI